MKRFFYIINFWFLILLSCNIGFGQNVSGYVFTATTGTYKSLTTYTAASLSGGNWDEGYYNGIPIGFTFTYGGTTYTTISESTNGWMTFGQNISSAASTNALNGGGKRPLIAPLWDNTGQGCYGSVVNYHTSGTAPNRVFTLENLYVLWDHNASYCCISYEVILYETTNVVDFIYKGTGYSPNNGSASIGITGSGSTDFWSLNGTGASPTANYGTETTSLSSNPADNQIYRWTPSTCTPPTTQATSFSTNSITGTSMNIAFTRGNGTGGVLVVARASSTPSPDPVSGTSYTANSVYGTGSACGGGYVVYNGTAAGVSTPTGNINISGLNPSTTYYYAAYEYSSTGKCYKTPALTLSASATTGACSSTIFSQNFEGAFTGLGNTVAGYTVTIPDGSPANIPSGGQNWITYSQDVSANEVWNSSTTKGGWGSNIDNCSAGATSKPPCGVYGNSCVFDEGGVASGHWSSIQSPSINLSGYVGTVTLNFYYVDYNTSGTLNVQFWNGAGWVDVTGSAFSVTASNAWVSKSVSVPASCLISGTSLKFVATSGTGSYPIGIDEISITGCPNTPSGNAYGIYAPAVQTNATVTDCEIYAVGGTNGTGCNDCNPTSNAYGSASISTFPIIDAGDATNNNTSCTNINMNMTTAATSPDWTGSTAGLTGTGSPKTANYGSIGRKTVVLAGTTTSTGTWTDDFETNKGWSFSGASRGAIVADCSGGTCITGSPRSGSNVLNLPQCGFSSTTYASITLTLSSAGTFSGYYKIGAESTYDFFTWKIDGVPTRTTNQVSSGACVNSWTAFSFAVSAGTHTIYLGFSTDGSNDYNGSKTIIDDVQCTNVSTTSSTSNTYTDFNNIITTAPSAGSILSSLTGGCPGTYYFQSSLGSSAGYSFQWAINPAPSGCITYTISTPTASSTNINFASSCATDQVVTVQLTVTSPCCGALTAISTTFTVNAYPATPTGTVSGSPVCPGGCSTLNATGPAGASFNWYDAASNGNLLGSGSSYVDCPAVTTIYYLQATSASGCVNSTLTPVSIVVTPTTAPSVSNVSSCSVGPALSINSPVSGATYNWYDACPPGGTLLGQGLSFTCSTCSTVGTYTYYVTVTMPGCNESSCTPATVTITGDPTSVSWVGGTAGTNNWFIASNWNPACLPTCGTDVSITNVGNHPDIGFTSVAAACQSITLASGATLSFSDNKGELDVCGNFSQSGTITTNGKGKVVFMGSTDQTFTKFNGASGTLHNVEINNSGSLPTLTIIEGVVAGVTYQDLVIDSNLVFSSGIIITQGGRKVVVNNSNSSSISGHGVNGYVFGRLTRKVLGGNSYDFPVGGNPATATIPNYPYELMNLNITSITASYLTVSFENPTNASVNFTSFTDNSPYTTYVYNQLVDNGGTNTTTGNGSYGGVWTVFPGSAITDIYNSAASTTAIYDMTLYGRNFTAFAGGVSIVKREPFCAPPWTSGPMPGTYIGSGLNANVIDGQRNGFSGFSQFALAHGTVSLPVHLVSFDAACVNNHVLLTWSTASESNNSYFTLERSCNENISQYQAIATIPGAGNSSTLHNYSYTDNDATAGECFYKLSQTDFNGTKTDYNPIGINCQGNAAFNFIGVVPNPADNEMNVLFTIDNSDDVYLHITDVFGQELLKKNIKPEIGINKINIDIINFASGVYFVNLSNSSKSFVKKVIKNK